LLSFTRWLKEKHFYVREAWNLETGKMTGAGILTLLPHQEKIFDEALQIDPDTGYFKYETLIYSAVKKSGKTACVAAVGAWYVEEVGGAGTEAYCIANDLEQAEGRIMKDIKYHFQKRIENRDPFLNNKNGREMHYTDKNTSITLYNITLPNDSFIQALAQSYKSVAGARHAITLWDELWGSTSELSHRVWDEMTPIPTIPNSLRVIGTYAGFENESDLLWDLYIQGVDSNEHEQGKAVRIDDELPIYVNKRLFTYWDHDPRMPWQTPEYYESQMDSLRPAAYLRLHLNQWVTSHEQFIPVEWYDIAAKSYHAPATLWDDHPFRHYPITIAIDAGVKRDTTALVGVGYDSKRGKVGELFHKIWTPAPGDQVDLDATVERELIELYGKFNVVKITYDPTHLLQTMLRLKQKGFPTEPFQQTRPNMIQASQLLYDLFKNHNLETYPDDEMRKHIQMAVAETTSAGFRIVRNKASTKRHHVDGAIALAMACYAAVRSGGVDISIPLVLESPSSDATAWVTPSDEMNIPFALRSEE
jgi:phage terminase large subunit-like protein